MAHIKRYFKVKVREPYMGNDVPLKIEVRVGEYNSEVPLEVIVTNPDGMCYHATEISIELFNE